MMWTAKHEPKNMNELVVNNDTVKRFERFVKDFAKEKKKALLLWGPTGVGKTLLATLYAKENNYELIELNASNERSKKNIEETLKNAVLTGSIFGKKKIVLIDEIDCTSRQDYGFIPAIIEIIKITKHPLILTATDYWDSSLSNLRKHALGLEVKPSNLESRVLRLKKILGKTPFDDAAVKKIVEKNENDFRAAINDAQTLSSTGSVTLENLKTSGGRIKKSELKDAVHKTLTSKNLEESFKELMNADAEPRDLLTWIGENMENYSAKLEKYKTLSDADVFSGRIIRRQYWRLLYYQTVMLSGINNLKGSVKYPELFKRLFITRSKRAKADSITKKLGAQLHASKNKVSKNYLPLLKRMSRKELESLELDAEEINYLTSKSSLE